MRVARNSVMIVLAIGLCVWAFTCYRNYKEEGFKVMMADVPRTITDKVYAIESNSYSCGKSCIVNSSADVFTLITGDGSTCRVDKHDYAIAKIGTKWKCMNLYGWSE